MMGRCNMCVNLVRLIVGMDVLVWNSVMDAIMGCNKCIRGELHVQIHAQRVLSPRNQPWNVFPALLIADYVPIVSIIAKNVSPVHFYNLHNVFIPVVKVNTLNGKTEKLKTQQVLRTQLATQQLISSISFLVINAFKGA